MHSGASRGPNTTMSSRVVIVFNLCDPSAAHYPLHGIGHCSENILGLTVVRTGASCRHSTGMPLEPEQVPIIRVYRYESVCCFDVQLGEQCMSLGRPMDWAARATFSTEVCYSEHRQGSMPSFTLPAWTGPLGSPFPPRCI